MDRYKTCCGQWQRAILWTFQMFHVKRTHSESLRFVAVKEKGKMANCFIKCCRTVKHLPVRIICLLVYIIHTSCVDYYLVEHKDISWLGFLVADVIIFCLFIASFLVSYHNLKGSRSDSTMEKAGSWLGMCSWFLFSTIVATKAGIIFIDFADDLDENDFFEHPQNFASPRRSCISSPSVIAPRR